MAVYFDRKLESNVLGNHVYTEWHSTQSILAVASYSAASGGTINLYLDEGEHLPNATIERQCPPTCLTWHPTKKILAVGWDSGEITIWNDQEREPHLVQNLHRTMVRALVWSSNGTRLLSCDSNGHVAVSKADSRGKIQHIPLCQHNLTEAVTYAILRPASQEDRRSELAQLAKAAASGDESALDLFSWKKGQTNSKISSLLTPVEGLSFFIATDRGNVFYLSEVGKCTQILTVEESVGKFLFYQERNVLVTITESLLCYQHSILPDGEAKEIIKVKLSGKPQDADFVWAGKGILATVSGEALVRMWDLNNEENFVLHIDPEITKVDRSIYITSITYSKIKEMITVGLSNGQLVMWKFSPSKHPNHEELADKWKLQPSACIAGRISQVKWGPKPDLLVVNVTDDVFVLCEQVMNYHYNDQIALVQTGPSNISVNIFSTGNYHDLKTDIQVKGTFTTKDHLVVWNGKKAIVYEYSSDRLTIKETGSFACESMILCMYEQNVYTLEPGKVQVRTPQGTVKQLLNFTDIEGEPTHVNTCGSYLVIGTSNGYVKLFDLSRREAKQVSSTKYLHDLIPSFGHITSVKCNSNGTRVSILAQLPDLTPENKMYVWDVELDTIQFFNFESGRGEQDDFDSLDADNEYTTAEERGKNQAAKDIAGRYPISHFWDLEEPKLLVCEAQLIAKPPSSEKSTKDNNKTLAKHPSLLGSKSVNIEDEVEVMVVSLFSTPENGILMQDSYARNPSFQAIIGLDVPYYYFVKKTETIEEENENDNMRPVTTSMIPTFSKMIARRTMRDYVGLENTDKNTRDAMMNFSYYLTIGNMDEAFKAIKLIKSESVWENMAKMCVKSRRLDVARVCLGNMGNARAAKALREAEEKEPELDAQVAVLALHLGLQEDAERLLKNCKRYDLLNDFYQSTGLWSKALETAERFDRVHLRTTYYNYGKHLESKGDINTAIPNFEKADTHRFEVPRMLFDDPQVLEGYIMKTKDKELRKWWAQYMESTGEMETALQFYEAAQDYLSLVRVYCYCGNLEKAAEICNDTGDAAASYHLARQYENQDRIKESIHFFTRAQAYGNAIRLCKEHGFEDQMMNLALLGKPADMIEAAHYYEQKQISLDKAVMLYHKAGNLHKALDLAFRSRQFGALQHISESLDGSADPQLLQRCANFFMENSQFDRAVDLLAAGKQYWEALQLCNEQNVPIDENLVEKLTVPKESDMPNEERHRLLEAIADVCMQQRQYHLATKKYTQAGNKLKAMKALLKSGDTEKIIFFAGVSRQKEIYVMAANYLQSLDWRKDPEIMKNIISFYTKGRAMESLALFYDACAQVEIDEYQNYDKALGALGEAYKCITKAKMKNQSQQEEKLTQLKARMDLIKKFVQARRIYESDPDEAIKHCQILLEETDLDTSVRMGDVYGFIIEHYASRDKWKMAYQCIEDMRARIPKVNLSYYINSQTIEAIYGALDLPLDRQYAAKDKINGVQVIHGVDDEDGEEVEEEVDEMINGDY
ncbi:intraflagellar transport protein 140 homolog [Tubulanus polymorphus]|uniref:intraflagellar transport protein 140 homolog n=1 Tax=Tubulanus polymorphus TaxID=672921 RepID=UPI003DA26E9D